MVEADRVLLGQALSNLLQNAVEAYPAAADGPISVHVRAETRNVATLLAIAVEDHGSGITPTLASQIGEPFLTTKGTGRGLGVLNVRRVVELFHGGTLEVRSDLGVGTCMTMVLHANSRRSELPRASSDRRLRPRDGGFRLRRRRAGCRHGRFGSLVTPLPSRYWPLRSCQLSPRPEELPFRPDLQESRAR